MRILVFGAKNYSLLLYNLKCDAWRAALSKKNKIFLLVLIVLRSNFCSQLDMISVVINDFLLDFQSTGKILPTFQLLAEFLFSPTKLAQNKIVILSFEHFL